MKRPLLISVALLSLAALFSTGCATSARKSQASAFNRPRSFALAVTVQGGLQPTPMQWAAIQAKVAQTIAGRGWVLVTDISLADHILRIDFTPNANDPENSGYARLLGIRNNPRSMVARQGTSPYPTAFGYSNMMYGWPHSNLYSNSFYGYGDYHNDYSGGSSRFVPVTKTPPSTPPYRHHPGDREYCPPGQPARAVPALYAGMPNSTPINDHPRPPPRDYGAMRGERVVSASRSSSGGDRSYSRYDSGSSRNESYFSHSQPSYSQSSYSPSYSSSDSYSAASSSASSSAAAASASSSASSEPVVVSTP